MVQYAVKPNLKLIGPKYGKDAARIRELLGKMDPAKVAGCVAHKLPIKIEADGQGWELLPEEVLVEQKSAEHLAVIEDRGLTVALDVRVTPELEREGFSRDIVRHIQQMRKEADFDLMDRIEVAYETDSALLREAIEKHAEYVRAETLCDNLYPGHCESAKEIKLGGNIVRLYVQKR